MTGWEGAGPCLPSLCLPLYLQSWGPQTWGSIESLGKCRIPGSSTRQAQSVGQSWAGNLSDFMSPKHQF